MNENYILLPSEVEHELNYVLPDPSITIELITKLLENTGWQNKSQKPYIFQNTVNYFDTKEHSIYTNKESLRLRSRVEEINGPVRATHKKQLLSDGFYAKRLLTRASLDCHSDLIKGLHKFVLDIGLMTEKPKHTLIEQLQNENILIERDGYQFYVSLQNKNFSIPGAKEFKNIRTLEIEKAKTSRPTSEKDLHLLLQEIHDTLMSKKLPLITTRETSYVRGHEIVYGEERNI